MKLEQSFEVAAPLEQVWEALIDVERVAPCLPGASVTGRNDDGSYNGEFKVKVGPTSAAYAGKLNMEDLDTDAHKATMSANGTDKRGQGGANATIVSTVSSAGDGATTVDVATDYHITGKLARFGRGGMIEAISNKLLGEFASNLQAMLACGGSGDAGSEATEAPAATQSAEGAATTAAPGANGSTAEAPDPAPGGSGEPPASTPASTSAAATGTSSSGTGASSSASGSEASSSQPLSAGSLVGSVVLERLKRKPAAIAAAVVGLLAAFTLRRRRA